jgi:bifunctional non-homologous end joining protein LigD
VAPSRSTSKDKLATYRRKRDFAKTPEPAGGRGRADGAPRFVVQRHRARRLHYDLRFEIDGVLVSWAVPKGPTLDAGVRRAAFHVEDHPIEYFDFEGVIPSGEYGGGDVIVWDAGTWEPYKDGSPRRAVENGELHAELHGEKLRGKFVLVRTSRDDDKEWLLLHKHDEFAVDGWDAEDHPKSVLSGRTNDEVKADPERMWRSDLPAARASIAVKPSGAEAVTDAELREFDRMTDSGSWAVFGRELRLTGLDKVLVPAGSGRTKPVTKRELVRYAARIAPIVLPHLTRRPMRVLPANAPDWLPRWDDPDGHTYLVVDEPAALVWAANRGMLEWPVRRSRVEHVAQPTCALIELETNARTSWAEVRALAQLHRAALDHLNVRARAKLTGTGGVQIWVPIARGPDFDETRTWVEQLSNAVAAVADSSGWRLAKDDPAPLAPYSPRRAPGAPVSTPIEWDELDDPRLKPATMRSIVDRVRERGDLLAAVLEGGQRLPKLT